MIYISLVFNILYNGLYEFIIVWIKLLIILFKYKIHTFNILKYKQNYVKI